MTAGPWTAAVATLALAGAAPAIAQTIDETVLRADELISDGRVAEALELLEPLADSGDARVEAELALAHLNRTIEAGDPNAEGFATALMWAQRSAGRGNGMALNILSIMHANGFGVPADQAKAVDFMKRAAEAGDEGAKVTWGLRAYSGDGVDRDVQRACDLLPPFADRIPMAAYYVGIMTYRGECGAEANPVRGAALIRQAAEGGDARAANDLGRMYENGTVFDADLRTALEWYERSAELGWPNAQWRVGLAHAQGEFRDRDPKRAVELFQRAADGGSANGFTSLAVMYATGDGVTQDLAKARELYEQAAELGSAHALRNLAGMYFNGEGVSRDPVRAMLLVEKSVAGGGGSEAEELREIIRSKLTPEQTAEVERALTR